MDILEKQEIAEDIPAICEFKDVFLEELPRLPPPREIHFEIELVPGAQPIFKDPYSMAPTELQGLNI